MLSFVRKCDESVSDKVLFMLLQLAFHAKKHGEPVYSYTGRKSENTDTHSKNPAT